MAPDRPAVRLVDEPLGGPTKTGTATGPHQGAQASHPGGGRTRPMGDVRAEPAAAVLWTFASWHGPVTRARWLGR